MTRPRGRMSISVYLFLSKYHTSGPENSRSVYIRQFQDWEYFEIEHTDNNTPASAVDWSWRHSAEFQRFEMILVEFGLGMTCKAIYCSIKQFRST